MHSAGAVLEADCFIEVSSVCAAILGTATEFTTATAELPLAATVILAEQTASTMMLAEQAASTVMFAEATASATTRATVARTAVVVFTIDVSTAE